MCFVNFEGSRTSDPRQRLAFGRDQELIPSLSLQLHLLH